MTRAGDQLSSIAPALGFLLAGVPLAVLMDRLGFFDAVAVALAAVVAIVVPEDAFTSLLEHGGPFAMFGVAWVATVAANLVNNLPAVLSRSTASTT
jgi:Na+/H+ antiporter NhaD/arsenite permease-like protein